MLELSALKFDNQGLIPAVVIDFDSGRVLTLAYMNRESLTISLREGRTCFWSRSRQKLWRKGEESGNVQEIMEIAADCDRDALLVRVRPRGPACHLGRESCFEEAVFRRDASEPFSMDGLYALIAGRKKAPQEGSYTSYLFEKGIDKILKKIGEESTEVVIAGKAGDRDEAIYEIADLSYHLMVLMVEMGLSNEDVLRELAKRHVVDKKVKQEKMQ